MELAPGVWRLATPVFVIAVPAGLVAAPVGLACLALGVAVLAFHRDPPRRVGDGVVSPADGRVSVVREEEDGRLRVGVFMSPLDVHVNRAPVGGTVRAMEHEPGAYKPAFTKDSERNERVRVRFDDAEFVLVAGWFARRIHPYVRTDETVERGERVGHISFGSRADVIMPPDVTREDLVVSVGDRLRAGETIARYSGPGAR
jgi:phosphatidylserine decarboxylase